MVAQKKFAQHHLLVDGRAAGFRPYVICWK